MEIVIIIVIGIIGLYIIHKMYACEHKYSIISETNIRRMNPNGEDKVVGTEYILQCDKCGKLKQQTFDVGA